MCTTVESMKEVSIGIVININHDPQFVHQSIIQQIQSEPKPHTKSLETKTTKPKFFVLYCRRRKRRKLKP